MTDDFEALQGNWAYPTAIRFGVGRIVELALACREAGMTRPLVVTDPGLADLDMVSDAVRALAADGLAVDVYSAVKSNPLGRDVDGGVEAFRRGGHDGVVAFGGGSALDVGKLVAFMAAQRRPMWDFEDKGDNWTRAESTGIAPIVAVPTTAGTGSEVGRAAVATNEATGRKVILFHPKMLAARVIEDPALTVGLPPRLTAGTGMDALAHNFEAYCAPGYHPMADGIALEGMRLIKEWLPVAVEDGGNLKARAHMMAAASMGATAFQKGLGAIHSLSHPVGSLYDTHHGLTNAVFMPYVMVFNRPAIEGKMGRLARYLGLAEATFEAVLDWVLELRRRIAIPHTAADLGVETERLEELARLAADDPTAPTNPVPAGAAEMRAMYEAALAGRLE
jgi:alcohol dehydrogenase class IV